MHFRSVPCFLLVIALVLPGSPCFGQVALIAEAAPWLISCGKWLVSVVGSYPIGKALDQLVDPDTARKKESELEDLQTLLTRHLVRVKADKEHLRDQLNHDAADRARLQSQLDQLKADEAKISSSLDLARSEIRALRQLTSEKPSRKDLARARDEINRELQKVESTLERHEAKLNAHDRQLKEQAKILAQHGQEMDALKRRLDGQQRAPVDNQPPLLRPSFDCSKARTPTELMICSDSELAAAEQEMVTQYRAVLVGLSGGELAAFKRDHLRWFKTYSRLCNSLRGNPLRTCVLTELRDHTTDLAALRQR